LKIENLQMQTDFAGLNSRVDNPTKTLPKLGSNTGRAGSANAESSRDAEIRNRTARRH
jgi:hypothetical protein